MRFTLRFFVLNSKRGTEQFITTRNNNIIQVFIAMVQWSHSIVFTHRIRLLENAKNAHIHIHTWKKSMRKQWPNQTFLSRLAHLYTTFSTIRCDCGQQKSFFFCVVLPANSEADKQSDCWAGGEEDIQFWKLFLVICVVVVEYEFEIVALSSLLLLVRHIYIDDEWGSSGTVLFETENGRGFHQYLFLIAFFSVFFRFEFNRDISGTTTTNYSADNTKKLFIDGIHEKTRCPHVEWVVSDSSFPALSS